MKKSKTNIQNITYKALTDPEFKKKLIDNPKAALAAEFGIELPPEWNIKVHEDTPATFNFVIPYLEEEMSDEELQTLAGGLSEGETRLVYYLGTHPDKVTKLTPEMRQRFDELWSKLRQGD